MTSKSLGITRISFWPVVAGFLMASLAAIPLLRYTKGLGAVTNLIDSFP